jgi:hypothetical protein
MRLPSRLCNWNRTWSSGESVKYRNRGTGESRGIVGNEDYVGIFPDTSYFGAPPGTWNDDVLSAQVYGVVEIVPEPSVALLLALALAGFGMRITRMNSRSSGNHHHRKPGLGGTNLSAIP